MAFDGRVISNIGILAAINEGGSLARAAETLGMTRSGVSRALSRLEALVGVRLFDRTTKVVALTDEGRRLYSQVAPLLTEIEDAVSVTSGSSVAVRGRLRVNVDAFFSSLLFTPHISEFLSLYPALSLELVAKDQLGDLVVDGFDIAVRFGRPPESSLVVRKLLESRTIALASPAYLRKHGRPVLPSDLAKHVCIQVRDSLTGEPIKAWRFRREDKVVQVKITGRLIVAEFGTLLGACLAGVGIARVKAIGVEHFIQQGALVELLPGWSGESYPLYALYPSRRLLPAKVRAFIDFINSRVVQSDGAAPAKSAKAGALPLSRRRRRRTASQQS